MSSLLRRRVPRGSVVPLVAAVLVVCGCSTGSASQGSTAVEPDAMPGEVSDDKLVELDRVDLRDVEDVAELRSVLEQVTSFAVTATVDDMTTDVVVDGDGASVSVEQDGYMFDQRYVDGTVFRRTSVPDEVDVAEVSGFQGRWFTANNPSTGDIAFVDMFAPLLTDTGHLHDDLTIDVDGSLVRTTTPDGTTVVWVHDDVGLVSASAHGWSRAANVVWTVGRKVPPVTVPADHVVIDKVLAESLAFAASFAPFPADWYRWSARTNVDTAVTSNSDRNTPGSDRRRTSTADPVYERRGTSLFVVAFGADRRCHGARVDGSVTSRTTYEPVDRFACSVDDAELEVASSTYWPPSTFPEQQR